MALVAPAREVPGVEVIAVAARDADKARRFAEKHIIPIVHGSYKALLADPDVIAGFITGLSMQRLGCNADAAQAPRKRPPRHQLPPA